MIDYQVSAAEIASLAPELALAGAGALLLLLELDAPVAQDDVDGPP